MAIVASQHNHALVAQDDPEPARIMMLSIDDKDHLIEEGKPLKLPGTFTNAKISVKPTGYRIFRYDGLQFRYPDEMDFESDHDGDDKTWTLDGDDASVNVMALNGDPDLYIRQSIDYLIAVSDDPKQKVQIKKGKQTVNGIELRTYQYKLQFLEGSWSHQWAVELPLRDGKRTVLSFSREFENGKLVKECGEFEKTVLDSLKF